MSYIYVLTTIFMHIFFFKYKLYGKYIRNKSVKFFQTIYTKTYNSINEHCSQLEPCKPYYTGFSFERVRYILYCIIIIILGIILLITGVYFLERLSKIFRLKLLCGIGESGYYNCSGNLIFCLYVCILIHHFLYRENIG